MRPLAYTRDRFIEVSKGVNNKSLNRLDENLWTKLKELNIARVTKRGCRGSGSKSRYKRSATLSLKGANLDNLVRVPCVSKTSNSHLKCNFVVWNAQSINNKTTLICDYIMSNHVDIMAISESWLYGDDRDKKTIADVKNMLPES